MKKFVFRLVLISLVLGLFYFFINNYENKEETKEQELIKLKENAEKLEKEKQVNYETCLKDKIDYNLLGEEFNNKVLETDNFLKRYNVYVSYNELDDNYYYGYKDDLQIYGASLIKLVDALYVLDNDIDINSKILYENKYYNRYNKGLTKHKIGEQVSIDEIVSYALSYSDNGAHKMLVDYIGFGNLKKYGQSLGAKAVLTGGDEFGMQTAKDTSIYLNRLYELSLKNDKAAKFKDYMINDFHNYLSVNSLDAAHKYGFYKDNFHDIGIVYEIHPYTISILSKYGYGNYKQKISEVSKKINELHNEFWNSKEIYCNNTYLK